ncbi:hypothetical protein CEE39_03600 [bacterium (candidate division B38) B3_B38]|nr:MAG: hypothetical protein CEE39_03600 [bacterium (candidate division B38) B3_B38]
MNKKYKATRLGIDWFTVTYKSLIIWSIIICIILAVSGYFVYTAFFAKENLSKMAQKEISKAEGLINRIRKWQPQRKELVEEPLNLLAHAREAHRQQQFEESIALAQESQSLSSQTLKELEAEESSERQAYFTALEGDVKRRLRGEVEWLPSKIRMTLKPGDMVKTGVSSSAQIMFFDGTTYVIEANSLIVIQESFEDPFSNERRVSVKLDSGKVDLSTPRKNVPTSASAITSSTTRAVLGETSRAAMSFEPQLKETVLEVYNGSAEVSTGKNKLTVGSLEKVTIDAKRRLASRGKLLPSPQLIVPVYDRQFIDKDPEKLKITFTWEEVSEAAEYTLQISRSSLFANPYLIRAHMKRNSIGLDGFAEGTYYWRVAAVRPNGEQSSFSNYYKFRLRSLIRRIQSGDITPPKLIVDEPIAFGNIFLISGKTEAGVLLTVSNQRIDVEDDGTFKDFITLYKEGRNELIIIAQDPSGNIEVVKKVVYVEVY